jgi:hypothetical protein
MLSLHELCIRQIGARQLRKGNAADFILEGQAYAFQLPTYFSTDSGLFMEKRGVGKQRGFFIREGKSITHGAGTAFLSERPDGALSFRRRRAVESFLVRFERRDRYRIMPPACCTTDDGNVLEDVHLA